MELSGLFFGPLGATFLLWITTLLLLLWNSLRKQSYWEKKGIPFVKPFPLVGNLLEDMIKLQHELDAKRLLEIGPIFGLYEGNEPVLSVADPELIKHITVKDFQYFSNRRLFISGNSIADAMISNLTGEDWKRVRTIITPTFTTGKLKRMIGIFKECSNTLVQNFKKEAEKGTSILVKKFFGAMGMDVIASSAFSTKLDSHNDPENKFVQMSRKIFESSSFNLRVILFLLMPKLCRLFGISLFPQDVMNFFQNITEQIIKERKRLRQHRNDFLQLLIDTTDEVAKQEKWEENEADGDLTSNYGAEVAAAKIYANSVTKNLSMEEVVGQCILFFAAGYETTGQTLTFISYCLALNPDIQEKARQSVRQALEESNGELTYETIQKMKYLDNVISETLRLYTPAARMERKAESDYKLGDTGITVEKGTMVIVPVYAIHRNPEYYPEPEKFDPDRFTPEEIAKRHPYTYLPFGAGPRNCLGMRFALLQVKLALIQFISNFNIKICPETQVPLQFKHQLNMLRPCDIYLKLEARDDSPIAA